MSIGPDDETPPMGTRVAHKVRAPLTLDLSAPVHARLDRLLRTGLYGRSMEDVAERLLCERIREVSA